MFLIFKLLAFSIYVFGGIWIYRQLRNAQFMDDEGNPIPTPTEGQGNEGR